MKKQIGVAAVLLLSACVADAPEETTTAEGALACHDKITICHHTHSETNPTVTISISRFAWPAHAKHGDTMGACEPVPPPEPPPDPPPEPPLLDVSSFWPCRSSTLDEMTTS